MDLITDHRIYSLSELLLRDNYEYRIPLYQRDYQWTDAQIDDFEDDTFRLIAEDSEHFFGTIVVTQNSPEDQKNSKKTIGYVIDGQQRLTTSLLALAALKHLILETAIFESTTADCYTEAAHIEPLLFIRRSRNPSESIPRLSANRTNQKFLTAILTTQSSSSENVIEFFNNLPEDERSNCDTLKNAYVRLRRHIISRILVKLEIEHEVTEEDRFENLITEEDAKEAFEFLAEYVEAIRTKAIFILLQIRSWTDAFGIFEGLNNRGLDLSEKDIVKNTILSKAHVASGSNSHEYFKDLENKWIEVESKIADTKFGNFLRHYLLMYEKDISLKSVLRELNLHFRDFTAEKMLTELETAAKAYETLTKPSTEKDLKIRIRLEALKAYDTERAYPIALAARLSGISAKNQIAIFKAIEVLYVRRTIIMHMDNKAIESALGKIARNLRASGQSSVTSVLESLKEITPIDELFIAEFKTRQLFKSVNARMMMTQFENHLRGTEHQIAFSSTTLEHILPQKPEQWALDAKNKERHPLIVNRIGNFSLLTGTANSGLSNKPFKDKKKFYKDENLKINSAVVDHSSWTESQIVKRQEWLANYITKIWPR